MYVSILDIYNIHECFSIYNRYTYQEKLNASVAVVLSLFFFFSLSTSSSSLYLPLLSLSHTHKCFKPIYSFHLPYIPACARKKEVLGSSSDKVNHEVYPKFTRILSQKVHNS